MQKKIFYLNWKQASEAAQKLDITSYEVYKERYKEDPRLPCCPNKIYKSEWIKHRGWYDFLGTTKPDFYLNWQQAS